MENVGNSSPHQVYKIIRETEDFNFLVLAGYRLHFSAFPLENVYFHILHYVWSKFLAQQGTIDTHVPIPKHNA